MDPGLKEKIILVSGIYSPDIGGPATYIPRLARRLREKGFLVTTISLTDSEKTLRHEEDWERKFILRPQNKAVRAYKVVRELSRNATDAQAILANGLFEEVGLASLFLKRKFVAKIVGDPVWERYSNIYGRTVTLEAFNSEFKSPLKFRVQRILLRVSLNRFNTIYCPSAELVSIVKGWGVKRTICTIENGVLCEPQAPSPVSERTGVISVSRLVSWKNVNVLIQACAEADLPLTIIGDGPEKTSLVNLSQTLGARVEFLGELPHTEVKKRLQQSKIFALVSSYEGLSFSLLEAMNNSVPVVVSDCTGNSQVIKSEVNGLIVPVLSVTELKDSLLRLDGNPDLAARLSQKARESIAERFCEELQLEKAITLLDIEL
jgi:glycosyltransferase involved in cell wall biosynthesis